MGMKNNILRFVALCSLLVVSVMVQGVNAKKLEAVEGLGCYAYGDDETPSDAKSKAMARAREQAVSSYKVWVESSSLVEDFQLKKDSIHSISAGMLGQIHIKDTTKKGQEICIRITGKLDPISVKEELERRKKLKERKNVLMSSSLNPGPSTALKIWLNKADGRYIDNEPLVVYVKSDRDGYLKLDYFQADDQVVHLVPNMFRKQARIKKGVVYEFGGENSAERFVIAQPFGDEVIKALVSTRPFSQELTSQDVVSEGEAYVRTLERSLEKSQHKEGTRGVKVVLGASAAIFTKSQEILDLEHALKTE
ncbi:MAG: DUF4384 domain-containing protein [Nitrospirales bacterium]